MLQPNDGVSFRLVPVFQMFQLLLQLFVRFSLPFTGDEVEPDRIIDQSNSFDRKNASKSWTTTMISLFVVFLSFFSAAKRVTFFFPEKTRG